MTATRTAETLHTDLQIDALRESPTNPRQQFDPAALAELAASIAKSGVLQPLLVRQIETGGGYIPEGEEIDDEIPGHFTTFDYEIVAGARRFRAAKIAELEKVPCIVRELSDAEAADIQIIENLQRADVHPVEEAEGYRALQIAARNGEEPFTVLTAEDIAKRVGKHVRHVATMLKLLDLGMDAKQLFAKGHITLDHALLLAPLTEADQEGALRFMLDSDVKQDKRDITAIIRGRLESRAGRIFDEGEDEDADPDVEDEAASPSSTPRVAKYMYEGRRLIDATPAQLKRWIEGNVLLRLIGVPWRLDDAGLTPAGPCTECEKRTGSNPALFGGFTAEEDTCTDRVCFAAKQQATLKHHKQAAKASGGKLLKISSKTSREELEEAAITRRPLKEPGGVVVGESVEITKKAVKEGQWVPAEPKSCADAIEALMVDGPDKGKLKTVCANQKCKVHEHKVSQYSASAAGSQRSPEAEAKAAAKEKAMVDAEIAVRSAVRAAMLGKIGSGWKVIQLFTSANVRNSAGEICAAMGLPYPKPEVDVVWKHNDAARPVLEKFIMSANQEQLARVVFEDLASGAMKVNIYTVKSRLEGSRESLWRAAKAIGVDANAIAAKILKPKPASAKKAVAKPAVKKAAKKKAPAKKIAAPKKAAKASKSVAKRKAVAK